MAADLPYGRTHSEHDCTNLCKADVECETAHYKDHKCSGVRKHALYHDDANISKGLAGIVLPASSHLLTEQTKKVLSAKSWKYIYFDSSSSSSEAGDDAAVVDIVVGDHQSIEGSFTIKAVTGYAIYVEGSNTSVRNLVMGVNCSMLRVTSRNPARTSLRNISIDNVTHVSRPTGVVVAPSLPDVLKIDVADVHISRVQGTHFGLAVAAATGAITYASTGAGPGVYVIVENLRRLTITTEGVVRQINASDLLHDLSYREVAEYYNDGRSSAAPSIYQAWMQPMIYTSIALTFATLLYHYAFIKRMFGRRRH